MGITGLFPRVAKVPGAILRGDDATAAARAKRLVIDGTLFIVRSGYADASSVGAPAIATRVTAWLEELVHRFRPTAVTFVVDGAAIPEKKRWAHKRRQSDRDRSQVVLEGKQKRATAMAERTMCLETTLLETRSTMTALHRRVATEGCETSRTQLTLLQQRAEVDAGTLQAMQEQLTEHHSVIAKHEQRLSWKPTREAVEEIADIVARACPFLSMVRAPSDAEKYCAFLCREGHADIAVSNDSDLLPFGAPLTLRMQKYNQYELIRLAPILAHFGMTHAEFVTACVLCGCDFGPKIHKVGVAGALRLAQRHVTLDACIDAVSHANVVPTSFAFPPPKLVEHGEHGEHGKADEGRAPVCATCTAGVLGRSRLCVQCGEHFCGSNLACYNLHMRGCYLDMCRLELEVARQIFLALLEITPPTMLVEAEVAPMQQQTGMQTANINTSASASVQAEAEADDDEDDEADVREREEEGWAVATGVPVGTVRDVERGYESDGSEEEAERDAQTARLVAQVQERTTRALQHDDDVGEDEEDDGGGAPNVFEVLAKFGYVDDSTMAAALSGRR